MMILFFCIFLVVFFLLVGLLFLFGFVIFLFATSAGSFFSFVVGVGKRRGGALLFVCMKLKLFSVLWVCLIFFIDFLLFIKVFVCERSVLIKKVSRYRRSRRER